MRMEHSILTNLQVAITSPDPEFNSDARDYFTRHMRILERCSTAWPMPEIQSQIDSLRLAFSADTQRPFELKPSFPYGSPSEPYQPSPPMDAHYHPHLSQVPSNVQSRVGFHAHPITPPISAGAEDSKSDTSSQLQSLGMVPHQPPTTLPLDTPLVDENSWDPTRIIKYVLHHELKMFILKRVWAVTDLLCLANGTWHSPSTLPLSAVTRLRCPSATLANFQTWSTITNTRSRTTHLPRWLLRRPSLSPRHNSRPPRWSSVHGTGSKV